MKIRSVERIILPVSICALAAAAALGAAALRLTRHEDEFRVQELRQLARGEGEIFAMRATAEIERAARRLAELTSDIDPTPEALNTALRHEATAAAGFIAGADGALLHPDSDNDWSRDHAPLFSEPVAVEIRDTPPAPAGRNARRSAPKLPEPERAIPVTRFAQMIRGAASGCVPWYTRNRFAPLLWSRSRVRPERIVGVELEPLMLLAPLIALFPSELPEYFRIELVDAAGKTVHAAGYVSRLEGAAGQPHPLEMVLATPLAPEVLPGYGVNTYIVPKLLPHAGFRTAAWLGLSTLLAVIFAAGGILFWLVRRTLLDAARKTSFVAGVSHELKTPLTNIAMYAEMLGDYHDRLPAERRQAYLGVIADESVRLGRLVDDVLEFNRLESGRRRYRPATVDLAALLTETTASQQALFAAGNMRLTLTLPGDPPSCPARIDRDSLIQVLCNLFANALKYAAQGGSLALELRRADGGWRIVVRDAGPGIPAHAREKIFRRFYRLDRRLDAAAGSGIGLTIARQLLRDQGGDLYLSGSDGGAEFTAFIPGA